MSEEPVILYFIKKFSKKNLFVFLSLAYLSVHVSPSENSIWGDLGKTVKGSDNSCNIRDCQKMWNSPMDLTISDIIIYYLYSVKHKCFVHYILLSECITNIADRVRYRAIKILATAIQTYLPSRCHYSATSINSYASPAPALDHLS